MFRKGKQFLLHYSGARRVTHVKNTMIDHGRWLGGILITMEHIFDHKSSGSVAMLLGTSGSVALEDRINWEIYTPYEGAAAML